MYISKRIRDELNFLVIDIPFLHLRDGDTKDQYNIIRMSSEFYKDQNLKDPETQCFGSSKANWDFFKEEKQIMYY